MLSEGKNRTLAQVGPGGPMGELLRRYWHPIAAVSDFEKESVKPVRLMGEDLVLYKDFSGNYGLIGRRCLDRGADLSYGYVEQGGLPCNYHGGCCNEKGKCIEQPFEERFDPQDRLKEKSRPEHAPCWRGRDCCGLTWGR